MSGEVENRRFKYNEAKRQSFYVEPAAANNIVKRRLAPPVRSFAELKDVFSVEQLTKEFYTRLFDWYTWALSPQANVNFPNDLDDDVDDRRYNNEAIIRMITRLMFTWFIRQRKLVPDVLFDREGLKALLKNFDAESMEQDSYYRAILQNLFFATFNCPQKGKGKMTRRWIDADVNAAGNGVRLSSDYRVTTVYRYKNEFKAPDEFLELMKRVPFLNCALFDCLDKIERPEDGGRKLYFDGFSTKKKRQAFVPNGLFFDSERGLVNLFNRYEFTVNENNADDSDVALDPELLGKVFENLLGAFNPETQETARNATGSFYTPREIVDYMVEESLRNYLKAKVGDEGEAWKTKLDDLFDRNKAAEGAETLFSLKEREKILSALYGCRILDPACGSGAFPMGVLHCMVRLLTRLDPQCVSIREHLLARYRADKAEVDPTETAEERQARLEELESGLRDGQHHPDYERKLYLIENCIYGVDIQPIATQISKLRFFISLLCDQLRSSFDPDADNYGLLSLPNLEAKFVCANTLIGLPKIDDLGMSVGNVNDLREELQANRHKIFRARSTRTKDKYKRRDLEIRDAIRRTVRDSLGRPDADVIARCREQIAEARWRRAAVAEPKWEMREVAVQGNLFSPTQRRIDRVDANKTRREELDAEIAWAERKIREEQAKADQTNDLAATRHADLVAGWDPYDQNASSPFFDPKWMFNIKDGFDIVIGNPPYIQLQANGGELAKIYQDKGFETFDRTGDIYCLFYERGWQLLNPNGLVSYITSDKWMRNDYGRPFRKFLREKTDCQLLIDFAGQQLFNAATVEANILQFARRSRGVCTPRVCSLFEFEGNFISNITNKLFHCQFEDDGSWAILSRRELDLKKKLEMVGRKLGELKIEINYGIKTGLNPAFVVDKETYTKLVNEDRNSIHILKPVLRGRDVRRYAFQQTMWVIDSHNGHRASGTERIAISNYPAVKRHLDKYRKELEKRGDQGDTPYNLRDCAYWDQLGKEKIIWGELSDKAKFVLSKCYVLNTCFFMVGEKLHYLLGLLNSRLVAWYFPFISTKSGMGTTRWLKYTIEQLPIVYPSSKQEDEISSIVDRILAAKKIDPTADTSALESEIDQLVYKLYGLTEEEIAVVEGRSGAVKSTGESDSPKENRSRRRGTRAATAVVKVEDEEELE
ncbi:MAG: Eco57I restriction-modification methylase domain-containing protein [bacterium]|nr:Eco57I restriction-modification methylase domain-containing protein [bacterium]